MEYSKLRDLMADAEWLANLNEKTCFLTGTVNIRQRLWHIDNNIFTIPVCKSCTVNSVKWSIKNQTYSTYCCAKCASLSTAVQNKRAATCLEKYGHSSNLASDTNKKKQRTTCLQKYGVDNFAKSSQFKEKYTDTCMTRYGVTNASKLETTKLKIDQTHQLNHGRKRQSQVNIPIDIINIKNDVELMHHWYYELKMPVTEIASILKVNHSQLCVHFKENLGIDITRHSVSSIERQVGEYLTQMGINFVGSDRIILRPKELDIFAADYNIAIEINGLAWHSELRGKKKLYHVNKMTACNQQGIRLLQILDSEWNNKQEIVKSRLAGVFQKNQTIGARKCKIVQINSADAANFFNKTHIQGSCVQSLAYALVYNDKIVAVMSFGKSRFNKRYQWELLRYSTELYTNIAGGASKLFSYFVNTHLPQSVVSYCDLRWNTGKVYTNIGFTQLAQSDPNYWYTKNYQSIESRMRYQKHKLSKLLPLFDPSKTEWENMAANGYDRIWDCGNLVFTWTSN